MRFKSLCVISIISLLILMMFPTPKTSAAGDALINPANMFQDVLNRQVLTYNQVYHIATSYYLRFCDAWVMGHCVHYSYYPDWRVVGGWAQRRYDEPWNWHDSGLAWAYLKINQRNVEVEYPENGVKNGGFFQYYYYCPLDRSSDGSNKVGFSYLDGAPRYFGGYVEANYDLPWDAVNHVSRPTGLQVENTVRKPSEMTIADGIGVTWDWVTVCNAARHYLGRDGYEARVQIETISLDLVQLWWHPWWRLASYYDYSVFPMDF